MYIQTPVHVLAHVDGRSRIYIKDETKQPSGSFKLRGVTNKLSSIHEPAVVTASTGNHAIAVAMLCRSTERLAHVFVPKDTPEVKLNRLRLLGASINTVSSDYSGCVQEALLFSRSHSIPYVPSFDDPDIIVGHDTLFEELDGQTADLREIYVPVGGGGLLAAALKHYENEKIEITGVEAAWAAKLQQSIDEHRCVVLNSISGPAEGIQVRAIGAVPFQSISAHHIKTRSVTETQILAAMKKLWTAFEVRAEGAGAASLAAVLNEPNRKGNAACIVSGGNVDDEYFQLALRTGSVTEDYVEAVHE